MRVNQIHASLVTKELIQQLQAQALHQHAQVVQRGLIQQLPHQLPARTVDQEHILTLLVRAILVHAKSALRVLILQPAKARNHLRYVLTVLQEQHHQRKEQPIPVFVSPVRRANLL